MLWGVCYSVVVQFHVLLYFMVLCVGSQGLKKPYNPIIGETFRCLWLHQRTNSKTFYIAEQVS